MPQRTGKTAPAAVRQYSGVSQGRFLPPLSLFMSGSDPIGLFAKPCGAWLPMVRLGVYQRATMMSLGSTRELAVRSPTPEAIIAAHERGLKVFPQK
jgi:hypothetical protein